MCRSHEQILSGKQIRGRIEALSSYIAECMTISAKNQVFMRFSLLKLELTLLITALSFTGQKLEHSNGGDLQDYRRADCLSERVG